MNNAITYKKILCIGSIVAILFGVFLHFAYTLSGSNILVGIFTPVNESVWEHLKLILVPFTIFSIAFYFYTKQRFSNMLLLTVFGNIVGMFTTVVLHYIGEYIFTGTNMYWDILAYVLSMATAFYILYLGLYNKDFLEETRDSTIIGACALSLLFAVFVIVTHSPLRIDMAKDPITNTYGIERNA